MFSVGIAATVTPSKKERLSPGTKSSSYGKTAASQLIWRPCPMKGPNRSSLNARTSCAVMPEWIVLRYMWYATMAIGRARNTHSCCALMIA